MSNEPVPFTLPRPEMNAWSWLRDGVHGPRALPPLVGDVLTEWFGQVVGRPIAVVNGYVYLSMGPGAASARFEQAPQPDPAEAWYQFYAPRVEVVAAWVRDRDWDALGLEAIVEALPDVFSALASAFASTMAPLSGLGSTLGGLIAFCEQHFGDGESRAIALLAGHENATSAIGEQIAALARLAASEATVAAAVRAGDLRALADDPRAQAWREAFAAFLDEYGRGNETWFEFHLPTWHEAPSVPLGLVARFMDRGDGGLPRERAGAARHARLAAALAALPGPEERTRLEELVAANRHYVGVIEDRARLQLVLAAAPRAPLLAAGRQLAAEGLLAAAGDVFFLWLDELRAGRSAIPGQGEIAARRAAWQQWQSLQPPESLGAPLPPGIERVAPLRQQFGVGAPLQAGDGIVRGFGASDGIAVGTARVVAGVEDGERLQPGEILVCRNTAPPWTPLFAIAGAVVVESGGIFSHAAIAAREYAIPAVVGAREATRLIPDGAALRVDGSAGTVTLLD